MEGAPPPLLRLGCIVKTHTFIVLMKVTLGAVFAFLTNFVPDEFWQTTEVAHNTVFGFGHLTWEWYAGIRNHFLPGVIGVIYQFGKIFGYSETPGFLIIAPQLFQGLLSLMALKLYFHFCVDRMGIKVGKWAYMLMLTNWLTTYCFSRTITNTTELSFNVICLYHLQRGNPGFFLTFLVTNFFIRPTAAIFWIPFIPEFFKKFKILEISYSACFGTMIGLYMIVLDTIMYQRFIITPWEFFKFNFLFSGNEEFGVHHPLWYFFAGLPAAVGPIICFLPFGFFVPGETRKLSLCTLFYLTVFSCIGHKEIRFLLPVLPLVFIIIASVAWECRQYIQRNELLDEETRENFLAYVFKLFVFTNVVFASYFGVFHQRGFRAAAIPFQQDDLPLIKYRQPEVWILAPCYSMPIYTYIHNENANFVHFICPPKGQEHWYDFDDPKSTLMLQKDSFNIPELVHNIHIKYKARGLPDWIFTYAHHGLPILQTLGKLQKNATYLPKDKRMHNIFGEDDKYVVLFKRVK